LQQETIVCFLPIDIKYFHFVLHSFLINVLDLE
jgi:hypothetical protein